MDDDCEPERDALRLLLEQERSGAAVLAPLVVTAAGELLPLARGWLRPGWFRAPLVGLRLEDVRTREIEHVSLVGPLVRAEAARATDPPRRDFFIWYDDLEWVSRLRRLGSAWLIPEARIVHHDARPLTSTGIRAKWRDFRRGYGFAEGWKRCYGLRNLIYCGARDGYVTRGRAASYVAVAAVRALLFERPLRRTLWTVVRYALDGWAGRFRNLPPELWAGLAEAPDPAAYVAAGALTYDHEPAGEIRPL